MTQRLDGKGHDRLRLGTRRDGFFRLPKKPNGVHGKAVLLDKPNGHAHEIREPPKALANFIATMQERAARFDPFPTSWK